MSRSSSVQIHHVQIDFENGDMNNGLSPGTVVSCKTGTIFPQTAAYFWAIDALPSLKLPKISCYMSIVMKYIRIAIHTKQMHTLLY